MSSDADSAPAADEPLEGYESSPHGLTTYPLDNVLIRTEQRTVVDVLRRIEKEMFKLDPDFQRDFLWSRERQSRLIESILMRIPLPVFYVAEDKAGVLVVVDGLQRLTTLQRFSKGDLALALPGTELDGKTIKTIAPRLQNRFEDGQLQFYIIDSKAPERVRLDIFDRVNSGVALTRQQMRNALYSGPATILLRDLARMPEFKEATGFALAKKKYEEEQKDREAINRFFAFRVLGWRTYGSAGYVDMDEFLGGALRAINSVPVDDVEIHRAAFLRAMRMNHAVYERHAFRKHTSHDQRRFPFNVVLFEVFATLFAAYDELRVQGGAEELRYRYYELLGSPRFLSAISSATTAPENVATRFQMAEEMMRSVLGDP